MKFSCLQENLAHGISIAGHIALRASTLPVLSNVQLIAKNGALTLSATNLEAGVHTTVRGKVENEGECLIPARLLLDLVPLLDAGPLVGELTDNGLTITTENAATTLRVHPTADFPIIPTVEEGQTIVLERDVFVEALNRVVVAAGKVENRPQFNGVLMSTKEKSLVCVATDGFRLSEATISLAQSTTDTRGIIPLPAAQEIARVLGGLDDEPELTLIVAENQMKVSTASSTIVTRLIEGEYPDYLPLFPIDPTTKGLVEPAVLTKALKASSLFSRAGVSGVVLDIDPGAKEIRVSSENGEVGAHQTTLVFKGEGEIVRVIANARYILDGISGLGGAAVFQLMSADRPLLITPEKTGKVSFRYLVMPIRQ